MGRDVAGPGRGRTLPTRSGGLNGGTLPAVLGEVIDVDGHRLELVGVAERSFDGLHVLCAAPLLGCVPVDVPAGPRDGFWP